MKTKNCILFSALTISERLYGSNFSRMLNKTFRVWQKGVVQTCDGDMGTFNHGENIGEVELVVELGIPVEVVLKSLTYNGWLACGSHKCGRVFGWLGEGTAADIIALDESPLDNISIFKTPSFVMKDGKVYKSEGKCAVRYVCKKYL